MQQKTPLKAFVDAIFSINATYANILGTGTVGVGATPAVSTGASSSSTAIVDQLHKEAAYFVKAANAPNPDRKAMTVHAQAIEGCLRMLETLGQISETLCDSLLDDMARIVSD